MLKFICINQMIVRELAPISIVEASGTHRLNSETAELAKREILSQAIQALPPESNDFVVLPLDFSGVNTIDQHAGLVLTVCFNVLKTPNWRRYAYLRGLEPGSLPQIVLSEVLEDQKLYLPVMTTDGVLTLYGRMKQLVDQTKTLWKFLAEEGEWYSPKEIANELDSFSFQKTTVRSVLDDFHSRGVVIKDNERRGFVKYLAVRPSQGVKVVRI